MAHHRGHGHGHHVDADHAHAHDELPELLDLDAEVLADVLADVRDEIDRLLDAPVRRILDVGAGTGTGTFALLRHFPDALAVAVDASEEMLARLRRRAAELGCGERVATVCADLDDGVPGLDPVDVAWASASLHHLADPDRTLAGLVEVVRPGGLLAVVELAGFPRFVQDGTPGSDAEARAHLLLAADRAVDLPTMGSDWGARLARAGLVVETERTIAVDLPGSSTPAAGTYAAASLGRVRDAVADRLSAAERDALDALLDGGKADVRRRDDLRVRTERQLWIGRRPA